MSKFLVVGSSPLASITQFLVISFFVLNYGIENYGQLVLYTTIYSLFTNAVFALLNPSFSRSVINFKTSKAPYSQVSLLIMLAPILALVHAPLILVLEEFEPLVQVWIYISILANQFIFFVVFKLRAEEKFFLTTLIVLLNPFSKFTLLFFGGAALSLNLYIFYFAMFEILLLLVGLVLIGFKFQRPTPSVVRHIRYFLPFESQKIILNSLTNNLERLVLGFVGDTEFLGVITYVRKLCNSIFILSKGLWMYFMSIFMNAAREKNWATFRQAFVRYGLALFSFSLLVLFLTPTIVREFLTVEVSHLALMATAMCTFYLNLSLSKPVSVLWLFQNKLQLSVIYNRISNVSYILVTAVLIYSVEAYLVGLLALSIGFLVIYLMIVRRNTI